MMREIQEKPKRAVVCAVQMPGVSDFELESSITELRQLAKTLGFEVVGTFTQKRSSFDSAAYLGVGKRKELRRFVRNEPEPEGDAVEESASAEDEPAAVSPTPAAESAPGEGVPREPVAGEDSKSDEDDKDDDDDDEEEVTKPSTPTKRGPHGHGRAAREAHRAERAGAKNAKKEAEEKKEAEDAPPDEELRRADVILVDHEVSPSQARNLENEVGIEVMDRTMVILEIFHRHARSRAARVQVEIVRLSYMAPRMREEAKSRAAGGRQRSGVGGRGAGESKGELDRRKIRDRIKELQEELVGMDTERRTQRARRQERSGLARVALVGYTNAGKSTLMRSLTQSDVLVADKLFATLDTTVRTLQPETVPRILVSDTVGFIKNLPHGLVASFKSTLDEALEASLLAHVIDASDPGFERQHAVTEEVLNEIGASAVPRMLVFNKIDRVGDEAAQAERIAALTAAHPGCIVMSARQPEDMERLREEIVGFFRKGLVEAELLLPWSAQQLRGEIFASCEVLEERAEAEGAFFRVRGNREDVKKLRQHIGVPEAAEPE